MLTLTDVAAVRSAGSLKSTSETGAAQDRQIQSAIRLAAHRMQDEVSVDYAEVLAYTEADLAEPTKKEKRDRFTQAEASFAISELVGILSSGQLAPTGLVQSIETSQKTTNMAAWEEGQKVAQNWVRAAYKWLAPYLTAEVTDSEGNVKAFESKNKRFYFGAI